MGTTLAAIEDSIRAHYGDKALVTEWLTVEQSLIDQFAEATMDPDWMHIDPERAAAEGPFGGTIAFGFWTLSMLTYFNRSFLEAEYPDGVKYGFNYGLNKVRMMAPVPVGGRIRDRIRLVDIRPREESGLLVTTDHTIEVEGSEKPALIAEWLYMIVVDSAETG